MYVCMYVRLCVVGVVMYGITVCRYGGVFFFLEKGKRDVCKRGRSSMMSY